MHMEGRNVREESEAKVVVLLREGGGEGRRGGEG